MVALGKLGMSRAGASAAESILPKVAISADESSVVGRSALDDVTRLYGDSKATRQFATAETTNSFASAMPPLKDGMVRLYRGEAYPTFAERLQWKLLPGRSTLGDSMGAGLFYSPSFETARVYADRALEMTGTSRVLYLDLPKEKALDKYIIENSMKGTGAFSPVLRRMSESERLARTEELFSGKLKNPELVVPRRYRNAGEPVPDSVYRSVAPNDESFSWRKWL